MSIQDDATGAVIPHLLRGTRDYVGAEARRRAEIIAIIVAVYRLFGADPLETPIIETTRTLGVEGGDTGKNVFRLTAASNAVGFGLRFDHTVPLARYAGMNWNLLPMPWTRYAIGPVFRDERGAGAGRLSQFTQCDFDTIGEQNAPLVDAQNIAIAYEILSRLGFMQSQYEIRINDRRLMNAIVSAIGLEQVSSTILREWDKLDKQSPKQACQNLRDLGFDEFHIRIFDVSTSYILEVVDSQISTYEKLQLITRRFSIPQVLEAVESLREVFVYLDALGVPESAYAFNPLLARGLDYYTGPIFETVIVGSGSGSIMGGGRFDKLIAKLGGPDLQASGFSFGLERLIDVMRELDILPPVEQDNLPMADVFVALIDPRDQTLVAYAMNVAQQLRLTGIKVKLYTGGASVRRQLALANSINAPVTLVIGPDEVAANKVQAKNMANGKQTELPLEKVSETLQWLLNQ